MRTPNLADLIEHCLDLTTVIDHIADCPINCPYRRTAAFRGELHPSTVTFVLGAGYFFVWPLFGVVTFAAGVTVAKALMASITVSRMVPFAAAGALVLAGIFQLSPWKPACLRHWREPASARPTRSGLTQSCEVSASACHTLASQPQEHATAAGSDRLVHHQSAFLIGDSATTLHEFDHFGR